ncbi:hypothetical protein ABR25_15210, partial [Enterobacter kobei]
MLTWTTALEEQTKSQSEAFRKDQDLSKKANSAYAALFDDVHNYLTNEDVNQAFANKPTIIARLAELAMLLDTYCTWGPDGEYFNADAPTLDGETRFAVLELLSLEDKPKLLSS